MQIEIQDGGPSGAYLMSSGNTEYRTGPEAFPKVSRRFPEEVPNPKFRRLPEDILNPKFRRGNPNPKQ